MHLEHIQNGGMLRSVFATFSVSFERFEGFDNQEKHQTSSNELPNKVCYYHIWLYHANSTNNNFLRQSFHIQFQSFSVEHRTVNMSEARNITIK